MTIPSLPLPAVVALLLVAMVLCQRHRLLAVQSRWLFGAAISCYVLSLILISVRWVYDWVAVLPISAILAVLSSLFIYLAYRSLSGGRSRFCWQQDWPHTLPLLGLSLILLIYRPAIDVALPLIYFGYAWLLLKLALSGPDVSAGNVRLEQVTQVHRAIYLTAILLLLGGLLEIVIMLDFILNQGQYAATIVGYMNVPVMFLLGATVTAVGAAVPQDPHPAVMPVAGASAHTDASPPPNPAVSLSAEPSSAEPSSAEPREEALLHRVQSLLMQRELYADTELTLQRLARRAGVAARVLSREVNSQTGLNVSQWVNEVRIQVVCEKLKTTDCTISEAMYSSGFSTKSNFNREFRRVTGQTPSAWRRAQLQM